MINDRATTIAAAAKPASLDRGCAPRPLLQAEIHGLQRTRLLSFDELVSPIVRRAVGYWLSKRAGEDAPMLRRHLDAAEIPHLLPYLVLLEVVREAGAASDPASAPATGFQTERVNGQANKPAAANEHAVTSRLDFRYRVIGEVVLRHSRGNYTGKCVSEVDGQGPGSEVWQACTDVTRQRRPFLSRPPYIGPLSQVFQCESAVMPLIGDDGEVTRLLIACDFLSEAAAGRRHPA